MRIARRVVAVLLGLSTAAAAQQLTVSLDALSAPGVTLHGVTATLIASEPAGLRIAIESATVYGQEWRNLTARCPRLVLTSATLACSDAVLDAGAAIPIAFTYDRRAKSLDVSLRPGTSERWRVQAQFDGGLRTARIRVENGTLERLKRWLPPGLPRITAGTVSGDIALHAGDAIEGRLAIDGLAFSDEAGMHAGEKIAAIVRFAAKPARGGWDWNGRAIWRSGEFFWQPVYLKANDQIVELNGEGSEARFSVAHARMTFPGIGLVELSDIEWDRAAGRLASGRAEARNLQLSSIYEQWLKSPLAGTAFADLRVGGAVSGALEMRAGTLQAANLVLDKVSLEHPQRRFALFSVDGRVPWRKDQPTTAEVSMAGGEIVGLPFGETDLSLRLDGERVALDAATVPFIGGTVRISDFVAERNDAGWRWRFGSELGQLSVPLLTQGLGLPSMRGTLSGVIPRVSYENSTLSVGGALSFLLFDGIVTLRRLVLDDPFGPAPRLAGDIEMRNLDLDLLTRTFSFGGMTGRVDITINDLRLVNWQPVQFDARIASSPGEYRRTISQRAVQNISDLGGGGPASGIQLAILGLFDHFGYEKLGLSCVLRNGVCAMGGIGAAEQGRGYVIVKGGGIPALSVIGYNHEVSWSVLVGRLKRVMQENIHPVIK